MRIKFYRPVSINGAFFARNSVADLDDTTSKHWLIQNMLKAGTAVIIGEEVDKGTKQEKKAPDATPSEPSSPEAVEPQEEPVKSPLEGLDTIAKLREFARNNNIPIPGRITKETEIKTFLERVIDERGIA